MLTYEQTDRKRDTKEAIVAQIYKTKFKTVKDSIHIQDVLGGITNLLGGGSMHYSG
jgi:hypothetical protein